MKTKLSLLLLFSVWVASSQFQYEPSKEHPFGLPNPEAPKEILDFAPLIGECNCLSQTRGADGSWAKEVEMLWRFKYIMNGMAIQDETLKQDASYAGSIRQFIPDSTRWYVHYYSSGNPTTILPSWEGNKNEDGNIVLLRDQTAPNGMEGFYRITFSDISDTGFKWAGEWVSKDQSIEWPTWKISCTKIRQNSWEED